MTEINENAHIHVAHIDAQDFEEFLEWKARQNAETIKTNPDVPAEAAAEESPEELKLGKPILIGKGEGNSLADALLGAFGEVFGEEMSEKIASTPEFSELKELEDQIELAELRERAEHLDEEVGTLQAVLANTFLSVTVAKLALSDGRADDAEVQIDHAARMLLLTRLGKAHFHIHE